ncbi:hypothetical protein ACLOJK_019749 [Asimina triloba]
MNFLTGRFLATNYTHWRSHDLGLAHLSPLKLEQHVQKWGHFQGLYSSEGISQRLRPSRCLPSLTGLALTMTILLRRILDHLNFHLSCFEVRSGYGSLYI